MKTQKTPTTNTTKTIVELPQKEQPQTPDKSTFGQRLADAMAAITFANGGDNIGIYMPLFANTQLTSLLVILSVFFVLVGVWCYTAHLLTHQKAIALIIDRYGNSVVPFLLIGLGVYIALDSLALAVLSVAVVFLGWMSFSSLREHVPSA